MREKDWAAAYEAALRDRREREASDKFWPRVWELVRERTRRSMDALRNWRR